MGTFFELNMGCIDLPLYHRDTGVVGSEVRSVEEHYLILFTTSDAERECFLGSRRGGLL